ncbi:hypothetical protein DPMN_097079 [Dreissena polymorpha]|uniref:Uncharacterized protein n=1 Tax=Dreissena polymorpha TaxID=45954 RepID=A0A9D4R490_DREPO|nr:hypothetical protein DPMN_097079 [Dreissena polymorpha]
MRTPKKLLTGVTKLQNLCETRWCSRADALNTFKQTIRVVVNELDCLQDDNDEKAGLYQESEHAVPLTKLQPWK